MMNEVHFLRFLMEKGVEGVVGLVDHDQWVGIGISRQHSVISVGSRRRARAFSGSLCRAPAFGGTTL